MFDLVAGHEAALPVASALSDGMTETLHVNNQESEQYFEESQVEDSQLVSLEIDTQATDGSNESQLLDGLMHISDAPASVPVKPNIQPRVFQMPQSPEHDVSFKYERANAKAPVISRLSLSNARRAIDVPQDETNDAHMTGVVAPRENNFNDLNQVLTSRGEDVPRHKSNVGNDVLLPDQADNGIKDRLVLEEKDPNLPEAVRNMAMDPLHGQAPGCATPLVDTARRSTQAQKKTKSVQTLFASCLLFPDIEPPGVERHGPMLPSSNSQLLAVTPSVSPYLPLPLSELHDRHNISHQPFTADQDSTRAIDTPIPVTKRKHSEPQRSDVRDKLMGNKMPDEIRGDSASSTGDVSSHLASVNDSSLTVSSPGPESNGRAGAQSIIIPKLQTQQQPPKTQSNFLANQGSRVGPSSNRPIHERMNSPLTSANVPFPDISNRAKPSSAHRWAKGLVNRPISNNEVQSQRYNIPTGIQDSPSMRVAKTKKSGSNVQAIHSLSVRLPRRQHSETHAPGERDSNERMQKRDLDTDDHANQVVTSATDSDEITRGEKALQIMEVTHESNRIQLSSSEHYGPTGDPQRTGQQMKRSVTDHPMTSESFMEQATQLVLQEKRELERKLQEQSSRNIDLSKKNGVYEAKINELNGLNDSLRRRFSKLDAKAKEFERRIGALLEDHQAVGNFIKQNKAVTTECKTVVQSMRGLCEEAAERYGKITSYQKTVKIAVSKALGELEDQKEKTELNRQFIGKLVHDLQGERETNANLKKQLDEAFSVGFKSALDDHRADIYAKLTTHECELKKAIKNAEGETEQTLIGYLEQLGLMNATMKEMMKHTMEEAINESEPKVPKEIADILDLVKTLSTSIEERLQSADNGSDSLKKAGGEVLETLKTQIESMLVVQDAQKELNDRISSLQVANARLEETIRSHAGSIGELQAQLNDRQQELENCQRQLRLKTDELQQVQAKVHNDAGLQDELNSLQAANDKANGDRADVIEKLENVRAILQKEAEKSHSLQVQKAVLEECLQSAEAKVLCGEKQLVQHKAKIAEELEKQRIKMEEDKRMSLKREQENHVQKISGQKKKLEKLQSDFEEQKEVAEGCLNSISELHAQIAILKNTNSEQAAKLTQFEDQSSCNLTEYESLLEAMQSRNLEISQIKASLKEHDESFLSKSQTFHDIENTVEGLAPAYRALQSRLAHYEQIEGEVRDYSQKLGISIDGETVEGFMEKVASINVPVAVKYQSRSTSTDDDLAQHPDNIELMNISFNKGHSVPCRAQSSATDHPKQNLEVSTLNEAQSEKEKSVQVPRSPAVLDSQASYVPSPSPIQTMRQTRRVAQRRSGVQPPAKAFQNSTTEVTEVTTKVTTVRESRTVHGSQNVRLRPPEQSCHTPIPGSVVEDSQDVNRFVSDINDSPMTDISPVVDFIGDNPKGDHSQVLNRQRSTKRSNVEKIGQSNQKTSIPSNDWSKPQGGKPLKSILKRPAPRNDDEVKNGIHALRDPTIAPPALQKQQTKPTHPRRGLASVSSGLSFSKSLSSNNSLRYGKSEEVTEPNSPSQSVQDGGLDDISRNSPANTSRQSRRKRSIPSISSSALSEPSAKRSRLSMPYQNKSSASFSTVGRK